MPRRPQQPPFGSAPFLIVGPRQPTGFGQTAYLCDQCGRATYLERHRAEALMANGAVVRCIDCMACGG